MTPTHFQTGQEVEIIGPTITGCKLHIGEKFTVSRECHDAYTGGGFPWYPASSLRLVEELKIGDWIQVIGQSKFLNNDCLGKIFQIEGIHSDGEISYDHGSLLFPPKSLRKLTPDEIKQHLKPKFELPQETKDKIRKIVEKHVLEAIQGKPTRTEERLSAIESRLNDMGKQQKEMWERHDINRERLDKAEYKISVLEGERPEVIDREQIRIPANAYISLRSDDNGKVSVNYSDGGFELAKAVLDSMKET